MGKRLTENLSSLYIGAANSLKPKRARRKIVAYVESYDDISFWRSLLADYEDNTRYFEVMLPSQSSLAKGKKTVLMNQLGNQLGENMIACVGQRLRLPATRTYPDFPIHHQLLVRTTDLCLCHRELSLLRRRITRSVCHGNIE